METNQSKIRVIIAMLPSLFRSGIESVLVLQENCDFTFITGEYSMQFLLDSGQITVAIVDVDMAESKGFKIIRAIRDRLPESKVIAITGNYCDAIVFQVLKAQANACIRKDVSSEELLRTIQQVAEGENPIKMNLIDSPSLTNQIILHLQRMIEEKENQDLSATLTIREREILFHLARGLMNREIAQELGISQQTIKNHVTSILHKLKVNSREKAVNVAENKGLLDKTENTQVGLLAVGSEK
jgi:two-component system, NarL family, response regulator DegU